MFQIPDKDPKSKVNRFHFKVPRKWFRSTYSLPYLQFVPLDVMKQARQVDKPLQLQEIAALLGEVKAAKAIGRLNQREIAALEAGWLEGSGLDLGELIASSR
jgi:hypothetical protein